MKSPAMNSPISVYKGKKGDFFMLVNLELIQYSVFDWKKQIRFPKVMNKDLAEELGIHLGDGCLLYYENSRQKGYVYSVTSGHNERAYLEKVVMPLMKKLYNLKSRVKTKRTSLVVEYHSKALFYFKRFLGVNSGPKVDIKIPTCVFQSNFIFDFIRGLFDTDGCLHFQKKYKKIHYYPALNFTSKSKKLVCQVNEVLLKNGFTTSLILDTEGIASNGTPCKTSRIFLYGNKNLERWIELIGFSNPKNIRKLKEWQAKGYVD
ncbi:hypothetical protein KJ660_03805 [Candidatus Micrarchaeota archaeon]|nr:hypothetical protein [Candidatus Micrarchaeota archaeon]